VAGPYHAKAVMGFIPFQELDLNGITSHRSHQFVSFRDYGKLQGLRLGVASSDKSFPLNIVKTGHLIKR
jgi:hypothetical protein